MKAMVLAAGLGERMWPLTEERAKPSLPLINRPVIGHVLEHLSRHGVTEAVVNLHYQPESIRGLLGDGRKYGVKVHYSEEPVILGTAGGLKKAETLLRGPEPFFLVNSDSISDCDLGALLKKHRESGALSTLVLMPQDPKAGYSTVEMDERSRIVRIAGRPEGPSIPGTSQYLFTGIHIVNSDIFDAIPAGKSEINSDIYPRLISSGKVIRGHLHKGFWKELGNPRLYLDGAIAVLRGIQSPGLEGLKSSEGIYLDRVPFPTDVAIEPPAFIGWGAQIGTNTALLGGVVIGRQVTIGKGCSLRTTVVWDGARIGEGSRLSECIVTSGVFVPPGVSLTNKIFLRAEGFQGKKQRMERLGGCWMINL
jgi:NDP-sugar pyrophosphorylase family protein